MVNDEMLKKLKSQYIGVEVPDDEKMKLNEVLEYAKIDKKRKRKKVIIARWMISVAALLLVVIMPNTNETLASSLKNIPLVGNIFTVITVRKYDKDKNIKVNMAKVDSNGDIKNKKTVEKLNNDIKKYILPFPVNIPMHDQWIGLIGEITGRNMFVQKTLISYRRHKDNASAETHSDFRQMLMWRLTLVVNLLKFVTKYYMYKERKRK